MITEYDGMKVYADFDMTQCGLKIAINEGYFVTSDMFNGYDSPVFLHGPTSALQESTNSGIKGLYEEIKNEKYFIMLKAPYPEKND